MKKTKIKIFVSHRNDFVSKVIENPLYENIRSGAVFDKRNPSEYHFMKGDDSGDNISQKAKNYNELSVQYWAWKNTKYDYYGLCHYRRFISFAQKKYSTMLGEHTLNLISASFDKKTLDEHNLSNPNYMENEILKYDLICMEPISIKKTQYKSNYDSISNMPLYHYASDFDATLNIIKEKFPHIYNSALNYFYKSNNCYIYNCWIMNNELFQQFCNFQFTVLETLEGSINIDMYSKQQSRVFGLIGERLFGVFVTYIESLSKYKICHKQILFFNDAEEKLPMKPFFKSNYGVFVFTADDNYSKYLNVVFESMRFFASKKFNYEIIVIQNNISLENKTKLKNVFKNYPNVVVRFCVPNQYVTNSNLAVTYAGIYSREVYYKILAPFILENYEKIAVLDCDIIFNSDPKGLFDFDFGGKTIIGAKDIGYLGWLNGASPDRYLEYSKKILKMKQPYNYINSGVFLVDCNKYRKYTCLDRIIREVRKKYRCQDQDILNLIFEQEITYLPLDWNLFSRSNNYVCLSIDTAPAKCFEEYIKARVHPKIIHYAALPKPWGNPYIDFAEIWWQHARNTTVYERFIYDLSHNPNIISSVGKSKIRKIADKLLPPGTKRRRIIKKIMPKKGSKSWNLMKKIYHKLFK